jgi:HupE / UreJ protein
MRSGWWPALLLSAGALQAHVVSMSSGELTVNGHNAEFVLRMPVYELQHVSNPQSELLDHVKFADSRLVSSNCTRDQDAYICTGQYEFTRPIPDKVEIECTLFQVTVPNHVHLLHAVQGPNGDQVVFDQTFTRAEARFHPPSRAELIARGVAGGIGRLVTSLAAMVFLAALAVAARSWREAVLFIGLFVAGEWIALPLAPRIPLAFSPAFLESAMALTSAYLAVEILLLPESQARWMAVPILGLVHGLNFAAFPATYLAGASCAQVALVTVAAAGAVKLPPLWRRAAALVVLIASGVRFARLLVR